VQIKKTQMFVLAALAFSGAAAFAQAAAPAAAPEPESTLAFNVGVVTDYRYRGISQTRLKPALQGGIDYTHKSGLYIGTWASSIKWIKDAGGDAPAEIDLYGGYKSSYNDIGYDVGILTYQYPGHKLPISPVTTELYAAGTFGPATLKYSHAVTNLFGFDNSKNSGYLDLSATFDMGSGWSLTPHIGHQAVRHNSGFSYTDYSLTVGKDFGGGISASLALVGTDAKSGAYVSPAGKNLGRSTLVAGVKYGF
jgi:uncharacterized protein (TIGR02001 family)